MVEVLCLDSPDELVSALREAGHQVHTAQFGYGQPLQRPRFAHPPHEVDAIVCSIEEPVCFDKRRWGSGNSNFGFFPEPSPTEEVEYYQDGLTGPIRAVPRYQLVFDSQLSRMYPPSDFSQADILRAVETGGVPVLFFLDGAWLTHATEFPNILGLRWTLEPTRANRVRAYGELARIFPEYQAMIELPLIKKLSRGPCRGSDSKVEFTSQTVVDNAVGDSFGQIVRLREGTIWAVPGTVDNATFAKLFLERLDEVRTAGIPDSMPVVAAMLGQVPRPTSSHAGASLQGAQTTQTNTAQLSTVEEKKDTFISHASEDKADVARPLADRLTSLGYSVWFDEYELVLGDSLREKIDDGLRNAHTGIVVLSLSFFAKEWPRAELDGLLSLESGGARRIIPVWHNLERDDVKRHSPILAGRLGGLTRSGFDPLVADICKAIDARKVQLALIRH